MKLRHRISADLYIPQYQKKDGEWEDFKVKDMTESLKRLCMSIGDLQLPRRWETGQWYFNPCGENKTEDMSLIFTKEMYVMAFLGAAKACYNREPVNFEL